MTPMQISTLIMGSIAIIVSTVLLILRQRDKTRMGGKRKKPLRKEVIFTPRKPIQPVQATLYVSAEVLVAEEQYAWCRDIGEWFGIWAFGWRMLHEEAYPVQPDDYRILYQKGCEQIKQFAARKEEAGSLEEALRQQKNLRPCLLCMLEENETLLAVYRPDQEKPEVLFEKSKRQKAARCHEGICLKELRKGE